MNIARAVIVLLFFVHSLQIAEAQQVESDCGTDCLFVAFRSLGREDLELREVTDLLPNKSKGHSIEELRDCASALGFKVLMVKTTLEDLRNRRDRFACVAHVEESHFVLIGEVEANKVRIVDPPRMTWIPSATFCEKWQGDALLISESELLPQSSRYGWIKIVVFGALFAAASMGVAIYVRRLRAG